MKLQHLSRMTDTPVSTIKFYLREGLLPAGRKLNATTAAYGDEHVDRLVLIRALRQEVGLGLDRVAQVVEAVETLDPVRMMGRVQAIVLGLAAEPAPDGPTAAAESLTARDIIEEMGWRPGTPESLRALDDQLATMADWGLAPTLDTALVYARAVDQVAAYELSPGAPWSARRSDPVAGGQQWRAAPEDEHAQGDAPGPAGTPGAGGKPGPGGDRPSSGPPSADRMAAYTAVGVHGYSQLLLRLLSVAQGSYARVLGGPVGRDGDQSRAPGSPD